MIQTAVDDLPQIPRIEDLISDDTPNQLITGSDAKLKVSIGAASAATATADGTTIGLVGLAADNNTTSRSMAATPAGVAAQIAEIPTATPAGAATATADGTIGTVVLAADSDTSARNKASTPAGVAAQVAAVGVVAADINTVVKRTAGGAIYAAGMATNSGGRPVDYRGAFPRDGGYNDILPGDGSTLTSGSVYTAPNTGWATLLGTPTSATNYLTISNDAMMYQSVSAPTSAGQVGVTIPVYVGGSIRVKFAGMSPVFLTVTRTSGVA
jgi:hypothetical protein